MSIETIIDEILVVGEARKQLRWLLNEMRTFHTNASHNGRRIDAGHTVLKGRDEGCDPHLVHVDK